MWQEGLLVGSRAGVGKCRLIAKHFLAVTTRLCRVTLNASICGVWQSKHLHFFLAVITLQTCTPTLEVALSL